MNVMRIIQTGIRQAATYTTVNSPTILTGFAVAGIFSSAFMAAKGGMKAEQLIRKEEDQRVNDWVVETGQDQAEYPDGDQLLTPTEKIELTWRCFAPAGVMALASAICAISSNSINLRRNAALASLYTLTDAALKEYQSQVVEKLGPKVEEKVWDGIDEKHLREHPINNCEVIVTGKGDTLIFDSISSRYFKSDIPTIERKVNEFNRQLLVENAISLNEWYDYLNLEHIAIGRNMGWTSDYMLEIRKTAKLLEDEETPCVVLNYPILPHRI